MLRVLVIPIRLFHIFLVDQQTQRWGVEVVVLSFSSRPEEAVDRQACQQQRQRQDKKDDDHARSPGSVGSKERCISDEAMTKSELKGIATAATSGVTNPSAAALIPRALYTAEP